MALPTSVSSIPSNNVTPYIPTLILSNKHVCPLSLPRPVITGISMLSQRIEKHWHTKEIRSGQRRCRRVANSRDRLFLAAEPENASPTVDFYTTSTFIPYGLPRSVVNDASAPSTRLCTMNIQDTRLEHRWWNMHNWRRMVINSSWMRGCAHPPLAHPK